MRFGHDFLERPVSYLLQFIARACFLAVGQEGLASASMNNVDRGAFYGFVWGRPPFRARCC